MLNPVTGGMNAHAGGVVPLKSVRGRPKVANRKLQISVRYSPEVVAYFKGTGKGWQARMDEVLLANVSRKSAR